MTTSWFERGETGASGALVDGRSAVEYTRQFEQAFGLELANVTRQQLSVRENAVVVNSQQDLIMRPDEEMTYLGDGEDHEGCFEIVRSPSERDCSTRY